MDAEGMEDLAGGDMSGGMRIGVGGVKGVASGEKSGRADDKDEDVVEEVGDGDVGDINGAIKNDGMSTDPRLLRGERLNFSASFMSRNIARERGDFTSGFPSSFAISCKISKESESQSLSPVK